MKNTVILKGNKYGITIVLDETISFSQLLLDLSAKLENAENFFDSDKQLAITFEGRTLSNTEMDELLYVIQQHSKLNIQYVMEQNSELEVTFFDIIETAKKQHIQDTLEHNTATDNVYDDLVLQEDADLIETSAPNPPTEYSNSTGISDDSGLFYKGTLRSGQSLEAKESLIIIGDVNPGATVTAGGNIVVIGSLKGSAVAGVHGNRDAFIMALTMTPLSLQISDVISHNMGTKKTRKERKNETMIATVKKNRIHLDTVSKSAIQDIKM